MAGGPRRPAGKSPGKDKHKVNMRIKLVTYICSSSSILLLPLTNDTESTVQFSSQVKSFDPFVAWLREIVLATLSLGRLRFHSQRAREVKFVRALPPATRK